MNYKKFFSDELISLKSQGLYRKFRAINRNKSSFPKATERFEGQEREVEVWCSNDYLNLSQHPEEVAAMGERAKRVYLERFGFERSRTHYNELLLSLQ